MKRRGYWKHLGICAAALVTAGTLFGCGSATATESAMDSAANTASAPAYMDGGLYESKSLSEEAAAVEEAAGNASSSVGEVAEQATERKLIKNVNLNVETEEFDKLLANVESRVEALGGYIESSDIYNGSYTSDYRSRNANITARIPSDKLDLFITDVEEQSNVTNKSESVTDVTLQYVDLESHKKALLAEQESLLSMLEKAETVEDILTINAQLTEVRYQIESMESQLRTYDNQIDYSTVWLYIEEVAEYEPYAPKSAGERISQGFTNNLRRVGNAIKEFGINFVIALPILLTVAVIIGIVAAITFAVIKAGEKRSAKKRQQRAAQYPGQASAAGSSNGVRQAQGDGAAAQTKTTYYTGAPGQPGSSDRYRKQENQHGEQTMQGGLCDAGGTSECGKIDPHEPSDRPEDSDHLE